MSAPLNEAILYGNGLEMHDRIAGRAGDYAKVEALLRAGRRPVVGAVRENAFLLDKTAAYAARLTGRELHTPPLVPSPLSDLPRRFEFHLEGLRANLGLLGMRVEMLDPELPDILRTAALAAAHISETDLLRMLGIVCRTVLVGPHWFVFEVENSCNEDCLYCNIHALGRAPGLDFKSGRMSFERFAAQVDALTRIDCDGVTVLGNGEPTVHPRFLDMILHAKGRGLRVNFFTNGLLLRPEMSRRIVDARCDEMFCTISGGSRESFLALHPRQRPADYDLLMDNLRALFDCRHAAGSALPRAVAVHVICKPNARELPLMAEQAAALGFDVLRPQLIRVDEHNAALALGADDLAAVRDDLPRVKEICRAGGVELWDAFEPMVAAAQNAPENWTPDEFLRDGCPIGWMLGLAKSNGDLSLCCVVKPVGNLDEGDIDRLWLGPEYHRYRLAALDLGANKDLLLRDGSPLFTERCLRCDNHDVNRRAFALLRESGLMRFYKSKSGNPSRRVG